MEQRAAKFLKGMQGKRVAFCGIGGSNLPLVRMFHQAGAKVVACDRRGREALGAAAQELEELGVTLRLGDDYLQNLSVDILFRTPGMWFHLPELEQARQRGVAVVSEMELFFALCPCPIYAVTGSDGKTTTTSILAEFLRAAGKRVHLGGNIGRPLLPEIGSIKSQDVAVAELSSFQLISMRQSPHVAVVTNVSPNHLDVHKDMDEYVQAKKNILLHQDGFSRTVLNLENDLTRGFAGDVRGQRFFFSSARRCDFGAWVCGDTIVMQEGECSTEVMKTSDIRIPGRHNVENYLAAITAAWGAVSPEQMRRVAQEFGGVAHRAELVRVKDGVSYYNDSIGTSPTRTISGTLSLYDRKIILLAGGYDKKLPFDALGRAIVERVKTLILMGATADRIELAVKDAPGYVPGNPEILRADSMEQAVSLARKRAQEGDIVSLSPACASFDQYPNFEARGNHFKDLVQAL